MMMTTTMVMIWQRMIGYWIMNLQNLQNLKLMEKDLSQKE
uniref:Uncharacterized protein n=1 Tax=Rhizophora mucronata TaxID=61149 RepID=A0A2P2J9Q8_RHIMU